MRRCRAENRVRPVQMPVDFLETPKKARQRGGRIRLAPPLRRGERPSLSRHRYPPCQAFHETRRGIPFAKYRNAPMAETGGGAAHGP